MLALGSLAFANPWMLAALVVLPAIWWLLRVRPPLPKRVRFPAIRFLTGLVREEETPAHTPFWLLLLRMAIAALVILALADPIWNPAQRVAGTGPLFIVADNGWASAARWGERRNVMDSLIADARRADRPVLVTGTAPQINPPELNFEAAEDAAARARAMEPQPIEPDRIGLLERLEGAATLSGDVQIVWISDGLDYGAAAQFSERLSRLARGKLTLVEPAEGRYALALLPPEREAGGAVPRVIRPKADAAREGSVRALDSDGGILGEAPFTMAAGETTALPALDLPLELRNRIARLEIAGEASAGAVVLADDRWRRRNVGIVSGRSEAAQPLLSDIHYLRRSLAPYVELREAETAGNAADAIDELLGAPLSVLVLTDIGNLAGGAHQRVAEWVERGGMLIRFAGPSMAERSDDLVPVPLRSGGRALGGALSWSTPQSLAPFEEDSPFFGIEVPEDVSVSRQVLAEPTPDLSNHTWARLSDGTPLVTAARRGEGMIVLFHVTANRDWSSLPISGLFVEMLRRSVELSQGAGSRGDVSAEGTREREVLSPVSTLDGFGRLGTPPPTATPITLEKFESAEQSPRHPPGLYGTALSPRALNLATPALELVPLSTVPGVAERRALEGTPELRLSSLFLALALFLTVLDTLAALWVTGLFEAEKIRRVRLVSRAVPVLLAALLLLPAPEAHAQQSDDSFALMASLDTRLAWVMTGDAEIDDTSEAGLSGLSQILRARTAFEPGAPMGVNIERDELAFFPLLYWPMTPLQDALSPEALSKINAYMKNGGTILFDTRDQDRAIGGAVTPGTATLRRLLGQLDMPPLEPVSPEHVLTKSFYLMHDFPGRFTGGQVWVEASSATTGELANDGVTPIVVGANDYAAAWARDGSGRPLYPVTPGGERQREMADRFGVNLVIYALTGNYKSDQVHVPALLERLGQ